MKKITLISVLAILCLYTTAQEELIKPLTIGDTLPNDLVLTNVYNYPDSTIRLSDLKGKLVILDIWATWCGSCIETFPKLHELQRKFQDQLQVILVNFNAGDSIEKVRSFFEKRKIRTGFTVTLPYSLQQSSIENYFPFKVIPHYIWIGKSGKITAITSQVEISQENIESVISGKKASLHLKKDLFDNIRETTITGLNTGNRNAFLYQSAITGYQDELIGECGIEKADSGKITRIYALNQELMQLLKLAYPKLNSLPPNQIIIQTKHPEHFAGDIYSTEKIYTNTYCYDLSIPPSTMKEAEIFMQQDLFRYFRISVAQKVISSRCLILRPGNKINKIFSHGGRSALDVEASSVRKYIANLPVSHLINVLNNHPVLKSIPVVNETNIEAHIDFDFPSNFFELNEEALIALLKKRGFDVSIQYRDIPYTIINEE